MIDLHIQIAILEILNAAVFLEMTEFIAVTIHFCSKNIRYLLFKVKGVPNLHWFADYVKSNVFHLRRELKNKTNKYAYSKSNKER